MKKFQVRNAYRDADMIAATEHSDITYDFVGDYIEAETEEEAIDLAMDYIADQINSYSANFRAEIIDDTIVVFDGDEVYDEYYNFTATEQLPYDQEMY